MADELRLSHDLLRIVPCFRKAGAPFAPVHRLLPQLQARAAKHQLEYFLELHATPQPGSPIGTLILAGGDHFALEVPFLPTDAVFGEVSLQHLSETAPPWPYATIEVLQAELSACLRDHDIDGCCARLGALREVQEAAAQAAAKGETHLEVEWQRARQALESALGAEVEACCEGLRCTLFAPPNRPAEASPLGVHRLLLRHRGGGFVLQLEPPIALDAAAAREVGAVYTSNAAEWGQPPRESPLSLLCQQLNVRLDADGFGRADVLVPCSSTARALAKAAGVQGEHRQLLSVQGEATEGALVHHLEVASLDALPHQLRLLQQHVTFAAAWASTLSEPLLRNRSTQATAAGAMLPAQSTMLTTPNSGACPYTYRIEVQASPPKALHLLLLLPSLGDKRPTPVIAELRLHLLRRDNGQGGSALTWTASHGDGIEPPEAVISPSYAAALLSCSCSMPLTLAYAVRYASKEAL